MSRLYIVTRLVQLTCRVHHEKCWAGGSTSWRIKIAGRNINNLRYVDDTTLMTESEEELKSLLMKVKEERRSQDGRGIGQGDHFLPYKFIKRTIQCRANFTKQLLIASWGHQKPRKAAHCLWKEVGQNIKDRKRDKRTRDGDQSQEGSLNRGSFQTPGIPRTGGSGGS